MSKRHEWEEVRGIPLFRELSQKLKEMKSLLEDEIESLRLQQQEIEGKVRGDDD